MSEEFWDFGAVTDLELEEQLKGLLAAGAVTEARIIAHLAEVDARRLHARVGCSSLYEYCMSRLGLSEFEAAFRIGAARVARNFPLVFELLARRQIHLSAIHLLRPFLTPENHRELLKEAVHKSKHQIQEMLAKRYPRADAPAAIRPLPVIDPTSPGRYRLELAISAEVKSKLELARDLMSHSNPTGDLGVVLDRALNELIRALRKRRFGERDQDLQESGGSSARQASADVERAASSHSDIHDPDARPTSAHADAVGAVAPSPEPRGYPKSDLVIDANSARRPPNAVRRAVVARDGLQCAYVASDGSRCTSRAFLQFHHVVAWAHGGPGTVANIKLLCSEHNLMLAEDEFGADVIERAIAAERAYQSIAPAPVVQEEPSRVEPFPDKVA